MAAAMLTQILDNRDDRDVRDERESFEPASEAWSMILMFPLYFPPQRLYASHCGS